MAPSSSSKSSDSSGIAPCIMCQKRCSPTFTLPCHVICAPCLGLLVTNREPTDVILCPECFRVYPMSQQWRQLFWPDISGSLTGNAQLLRGGLIRCQRCLIRKRRRKGDSEGVPHAEQFCHQCLQALCEPCHVLLHGGGPGSSRQPQRHRRRHHLVTPLIPDDYVNALSGDGTAAPCARHWNNALSVLCVTCRKMVCVACGGGDGDDGTGAGDGEDHAHHELWRVRISLRNFRNSLYTRLDLMYRHRGVLFQLLNLLLSLQRRAFAPLPRPSVPAPPHPSLSLQPHDGVKQQGPTLDESSGGMGPGNNSSKPKAHASSSKKRKSKGKGGRDGPQSNAENPTGQPSTESPGETREVSATEEPKPQRKKSKKQRRRRFRVSDCGSYTEFSHSIPQDPSEVNECGSYTEFSHSIPQDPSEVNACGSYTDFSHSIPQDPSEVNECGSYTDFSHSIPQDPSEVNECGSYTDFSHSIPQDPSEVNECGSYTDFSHSIPQDPSEVTAASDYAQCPDVSEMPVHQKSTTTHILPYGHTDDHQGHEDMNAAVTNCVSKVNLLSLSDGRERSVATDLLQVSSRAMLADNERENPSGSSLTEIVELACGPSVASKSQLKEQRSRDMRTLEKSQNIKEQCDPTNMTMSDSAKLSDVSFRNCDGASIYDKCDSSANAAVCQDASEGQPSAVDNTGVTSELAHENRVHESQEKTPFGKQDATSEIASDSLVLESRGNTPFGEQGSTSEIANQSSIFKSLQNPSFEEQYATSEIDHDYSMLELFVKSSFGKGGGTSEVVHDYSILETAVKTSVSEVGGTSETDRDRILLETAVTTSFGDDFLQHLWTVQMVFDVLDFRIRRLTMEISHFDDATLCSLSTLMNSRPVISERVYQVLKQMFPWDIQPCLDPELTEAAYYHQWDSEGYHWPGVSGANSYNYVPGEFNTKDPLRYFEHGEETATSKYVNEHVPFLSHQSDESRFIGVDVVKDNGLEQEVDRAIDSLYARRKGSAPAVSADADNRASSSTTPRKGGKKRRAKRKSSGATNSEPISIVKQSSDINPPETYAEACGAGSRSSNTNTISDAASIHNATRPSRTDASNANAESFTAIDGKIQQPALSNFNRKRVLSDSDFAAAGRDPSVDPLEHDSLDLSAPGLSRRPAVPSTSSGSGISNTESGIPLTHLGEHRDYPLASGGGPGGNAPDSDLVRQMHPGTSTKSTFHYHWGHFDGGSSVEYLDVANCNLGQESGGAIDIYDLANDAYMREAV